MFEIFSRMNKSAYKMYGAKAIQQIIFMWYAKVKQ